MRFVIVEDEIRIREGIRRLLPKLDKENIVVGEAENGEQGLEVIRREQPDVIITDVRMPVMDGLTMLEKALETEKAKAIVLSAYSEFEYARSAIRLGVTEYLLKPINVIDFSEALAHVRKEIEREKYSKPAQIGSLDTIIRNILAGDMKVDEEILGYLEEKFGIKKDRPLALFIHCFEEWTEKNRKELIRKLKMILAEKPELPYCIQEDERQKEIRLVLYNYKENENMKRWIQGHFLGRSQKSGGAAMGWTEATDIRLLKTRYEEVERYLEWNIIMGEDVIISFPEIQNVQTALCVYPLEIEKQARLAICSGDAQKIEKSIRRFHEYFQDRKVYDPKNVKECYVRFCCNIVYFLKEAGNLDMEDIGQRDLLEQINHVRTRQGLEQILTDLFGRMKSSRIMTDNLNVKRAVAMVNEFYSSGITLDEIAEKLGITPEYLGTQFHQEMGINFSAYVKNIRMEKAKKLLLGTSLKLYEIAENVGYTDPKYFSKVFKAETGMLPADYRRAYK